MRCAKSRHTPTHCSSVSSADVLMPDVPTWKRVRARTHSRHRVTCAIAGREMAELLPGQRLDAVDLAVAAGQQEAQRRRRQLGERRRSDLARGRLHVMRDDDGPGVPCAQRTRRGRQAGESVAERRAVLELHRHLGVDDERLRHYALLRRSRRMQLENELRGRSDIVVKLDDVADLHPATGDLAADLRLHAATQQ